MTLLQSVLEDLWLALCHGTNSFPGFFGLFYCNACNWTAVISLQKLHNGAEAAELLKLMANIAEVLRRVLLDAHLCRLPPGTLMTLLLVIQSCYTDTDVVLKLWPSLQTTDVGVDDDGDCFYIHSSRVMCDDYDFFIFIHLGNLDWYLYYNTTTSGHQCILFVNFYMLSTLLWILCRLFNDL